MNKQTEALKMAIGLCEKSIKGLEGDENSGLCSVNDEGVFGDALREYYKLLQACKEALAEAEKREPVAWMEEYQCCKVNGDERLCHSDKVFRLVQLLASQSKEWQSLSDDEVIEMIEKCTDKTDDGFSHLAFAHAIEKALKEKNHAL